MNETETLKLKIKQLRNVSNIFHNAMFHMLEYLRNSNL